MEESHPVGLVHGCRLGQLTKSHTTVCFHVRARVCHCVQEQTANNAAKANTYCIVSYCQDANLFFWQAKTEPYGGPTLARRPHFRQPDCRQ